MNQTHCYIDPIAGSVKLSQPQPLSPSPTVPWTTPAPGGCPGSPLQSPCRTLGKWYPSSTPMEDVMAKASPLDISRLSCSKLTAETTQWRLAQVAKPTPGSPASCYPPSCSPLFVQPVFRSSAPGAKAADVTQSLRQDAAEPSYCH